MEILLLAATKMEIAPFLASAPRFLSSRNGEEFNFSLTGSEVDILITGVGAPACMYTLTKRLQEKKYDIAIQAGIAGTFRNAYPPGEIVIVRQDLFADLGIHEKEEFYTLFDKGFADAGTIPYTNGALININETGFGLPAVNAITINTVSDRIEQSNLWQKKYNADIESMEGAAFHYVCLSENIPFLQLRSISNFVGERVKTNWKMKEALETLNSNLQRIISELSLQSS